MKALYELLKLKGKLSCERGRKGALCNFYIFEKGKKKGLK
jgi:hypothetical protein